MLVVGEYAIVSLRSLVSNKVEIRCLVIVQTEQVDSKADFTPVPLRK